MSNYAQYEYLDISVSDPQLRRDDKGEYTVYKVHFDVCFIFHNKQLLNH